MSVRFKEWVGDNKASCVFGYVTYVAGRLEELNYVKIRSSRSWGYLSKVPVSCLY